MKDLIYQAKKAIPEIAEHSKRILEYHILIFRLTSMGYEIANVWDGWVAYLQDSIVFGGHQLTKKQVKQIIEEEEYLNYLRQ